MTKDEVISAIQRAYERLEGIEDDARICRRILEEIPEDPDEIEDDKKEESKDS